MRLKLLGEFEQRRHGYTHSLTILHSDLTDATNAEAQAITLTGALPAHSIVQRVGMYLQTPFKNSADAAFNDLTVTLGDGGTANSLLTSTQINANGAHVDTKAGTAVAYPAAADLKATFTPMAGKNLAALDTGSITFFLAIAQVDKLV
jgi:hypothetical protein